MPTKLRESQSVEVEVSGNQCCITSISLQVILHAKYHLLIKVTYSIIFLNHVRISSGHQGQVCASRGDELCCVSTVGMIFWWFQGRHSGLLWQILALGCSRVQSSRGTKSARLVTEAGLCVWGHQVILMGLDIRLRASHPGAPGQAQEVMMTGLFSWGCWVIMAEPGVLCQGSGARLPGASGWACLDWVPGP